MVKRIESGQGAGGAVVVMPTAQVLALRARDPWREATDRARQVATWRETVVTYIRGLTDEGVTQNNAVALLLERAAADRLPAHRENTGGSVGIANRRHRLHRIRAKALNPVLPARLPGLSVRTQARDSHPDSDRDYSGNFPNYKGHSSVLLFHADSFKAFTSQPLNKGHFDFC